MGQLESRMDEWPREARGRVHLVGVCGAGMKALAEVLVDAGCSVSGSDRNPDPRTAELLRSLGVTIEQGHDSAYLGEGTRLLIHSPAVGVENPERQAATARGIPQWSYVEALGRLMQSGQGVAIAGTHGKSTTTSMLAMVLQHAGRRPSVLCGAASRGDGRSGRLGNSGLTVVEACEYRQHFLNLSPRVVCLLGIEADHFDCYPTLDDACGAYRDFVNRVPDDGLVIYRTDCEATCRAVRETPARKVGFSTMDSAADWFADAIEPVDDGVRFTLSAPFRDETGVDRSGEGVGRRTRSDAPPAGEHSRQQIDVVLKQPGRHQALNALAAATVAGELGVTLPEIATGLGSFKGLFRRFETVGTWRGASVIDDYAHHPTEIAATLRAARESLRPQRIVCVFQPHQVSRTQSLLREFAEALTLADLACVVPVYGARERTAELNTPVARELVREIVRRGTAAMFIPALDRIWTTLETDARPHDLIVTMGAGDIGWIHHERI